MENINISLSIIDYYRSEGNKNKTQLLRVEYRVNNTTF